MLLLFLNRGPRRDYAFRTPTVDYPAGYDRLFGRFRHPVGVTVLKEDGVYRTAEVPTDDEIRAADTVYQGGHLYTVSDTEADDLDLAGYGEGLVLLS